MGFTPAQDAPVSDLPFYVWEVPEKPVSIQLSFDVIERIHPEVMRGLGALKRRGAEVGGILLGRVVEGSPRKVTIADFEPIPTEYLTGPSYRLSENDLVSFEAALARRREAAEAGGPFPVGFFRSHTRDNLHMDDADLALASRYFSGPENVFLLIKPFATRTSTAGFFFWEDGEIFRQSSYQPFPFHRGELGGGPSRLPPPARRPMGDRTLQPHTPAEEMQQASQEPNLAEEQWSPATRSSLSILSAPETPRRTLRDLPWPWIAIPTFVVVASLAGFLGFRQLAASKAPPPQAPLAAATALPLKLAVAERQSQLDVSWDRNAPAVLQARRGLLSIQDGANKREIELSGAQLRTGRVLYSRLSADVSLRLEVYQDGRAPVSELIRFVSAEPPPAPASEKPAGKKEQAAAGAPSPEPSSAARVSGQTAPQVPPSPTPGRIPATASIPIPASRSQPATQAATPPETPPEVELARPARRR